MAVALADSDAVFTGETALALDQRSELPASLEVSSWRLHPRPWLRVTRRRIPPEMLVERQGVAFTCRELTAIDRATSTDGASIDDALREGVSLHALDAVNRAWRRRGAATLRRLLHDSRDEPWSPAERRAHVLLRQANLGGWSANRVVRDKAGQVVAYLDLAFDAIKVAIEIDGDSYHLSPAAVLRDRARDRRLAKLGWTVIRFRACEVDATFVREVREVLLARGFRAPKARPRRQPVVNRAHSTPIVAHDAPLTAVSALQSRNRPART